MEPPEAEANFVTPAQHADLSKVGNVFSQSEISLTLVIFVFGLIVTGIFYLLIRTEKATPFLMRLYVVIVLVIGALLVVSSAYGTDQIVPVVGFFGTIAGYLLGKSDRRDPEA